MTDWKKLRELAEAATPSHSSIAQGLAVGCPFCMDADAAENSGGQPTDWRAQVIALLDEVERLQKSNEWNAAHAKMMARAADTEKAERTYIARLHSMSSPDVAAEVARLRDQLSSQTRLAAFFAQELAEMKKARDELKNIALGLACAQFPPNGRECGAAIIALGAIGSPKAGDA